MLARLALRRVPTSMELLAVPLVRSAVPVCVSRNKTDILVSGSIHLFMDFAYGVGFLFSHLKNKLSMWPVWDRAQRKGCLL